MPDTLSVTLSALADPTRRAILARLARGEATVNEIAKPFDISLPADLAYYVAYPPGALKREKVKAFRDWLFAEAESAG